MPEPESSIPSPPPSSPRPARRLPLSVAVILSVIITLIPCLMTIQLLRSRSKQEIISLKSRLAQQSHQVELDVQANKDLTIQINDLTQKNTALSRQIDEQAKLTQASNEKIAKLGNEVDQYVKRVESLTRENAGMIEQVASQDFQIRSQSNQISQMESTIKTTFDRELMFRSSNLKMIELTAAQSMSRAWGRVMWDIDHGFLHCYVVNLSRPAQGKTYQLWLMTPDQRKISIGLLEPDVRGKGMLTFKSPKGIDKAAMITVTEEPLAGSPQPAGATYLTAQLNYN